MSLTFVDLRLGSLCVYFACVLCAYFMYFVLVFCVIYVLGFDLNCLTGSATGISIYIDTNVYYQYQLR